MDNNIYLERGDVDIYTPAESEVHIYGKNKTKCETDSKGYATPRNRKPTEIVLDASEGFIPLWEKDVILRWRFNPSLYNFFQSPTEAMNGIREVLGKGILKWEDAAPVKFREGYDAWDFEIIVKKDNCDPRGCTLASAFFPDAGRHELVIYPKMFDLSEEEQIETMAHELGHIFGLRHFFAEISEQFFPSVKFGEHKPFSIMNYGDESQMTENDINDLKLLYEKVWSGELKEINGTPIRTFYPYHMSGELV